jgi:hypothetical protein
MNKGYTCMYKMPFNVILLWSIDDSIHYIANLEFSLCRQYICHSETEITIEETKIKPMNRPLPYLPSIGKFRRTAYSPTCQRLLQIVRHSVHTNVGSDKSTGLVDVGRWKEVEQKEDKGKRWAPLSRSPPSTRLLSETSV